MPVKSAKQFRMMEGIAHGSKMKSAGPSPAVADEMLKKTPHKMKSLFAKKSKKT